VGAPRVTAELNDGAPAGERVNHKRVARVMRVAGIEGYRRRPKVHAPCRSRPARRCRTWSSGTSPRRRRTSGTSGTSPTQPLGTNLYLATVIDRYSRRLTGWSVADHMRTGLVQDALKAAAATRASLAGAVFHSDHGSVNTSKDYARSAASWA